MEGDVRRSWIHQGVGPGLGCFHLVNDGEGDVIRVPFHVRVVEGKGRVGVLDGVSESAKLD